jgi:hypothetical protein
MSINITNVFSFALVLGLNGVSLFRLFLLQMAESECQPMTV